MGKRIILGFLCCALFGTSASLNAAGLTGIWVFPKPPPTNYPTGVIMPLLTTNLTLSIVSPTKKPSYDTSHWILSIVVLADNASSVTWTNNRGGSGVNYYTNVDDGGLEG